MLVTLLGPAEILPGVRTLQLHVLKRSRWQYLKPVVTMTVLNLNPNPSMKVNFKFQKWLLSVAGISLVSVTSSLADYQSTVLSKSPVGYWRLNDAVATPVNVKAHDGPV